MAATWREFGATEKPYENEDLRRLLGEVTGSAEFAAEFFHHSVYGRQPPDYESLLAGFGMRVRRRHPGDAWLGTGWIEFEAADGDDEESKAGMRLRGVPTVDGPLHRAGLGRGDLLVRLGETELSSEEALKQALEDLEPDGTVELAFDKRGEERTVEVTLGEDRRSRS